jgi:hypothetical protein
MLTTECPDNGGSKHLWNVGKLLPDYTATTPKIVILKKQWSLDDY